METPVAAAIWTDTLGTKNDTKFIDKIIKYQGIYYLALPLNGPAELQKRGADFCYPAVHRRIERDRFFYLDALRHLRPYFQTARLREVPDTRQDDVTPYWRNGYFSGSDARIVYGLVAHFRPRLVLEVGAGNSTKFFRKAVRDFQLPTRLVAIDPAPRADLRAVADEIVESSVLDLDMAVFDRLGPGDVLFWDGSHICFNGSDVTRLFLEVLPALKPGVLVHVHDICLPFEAVMNNEVGPVSLSEQYMLATFLLNNERAKVLMPVQHLLREGVLAEWGVSFWFVSG